MIKASILQAGAIGWGGLSVAGAIFGVSAVVVGIALITGIFAQLVACGLVKAEDKPPT